MNRLEEDRVTAINSSFYKNVFLLTQMIPSSSQFQQHFKKDMFDKPNTAGFLHVSHYLSIIYDVKLFKQMVKWPILCKKDETTYRTEIKNFFSVLSQDNPDIKFPSILMSHLVQSGGTKFLTFMWKLSQLALKTYIKGELQGELLNAPHTGPMNDLTITYLSNINTEMCCIIINAHEETKKILDIANSFINDGIETLNIYKLEIFERKMIIKRLVPNVSMHSLIQERLMDIEDLSIINLWKMDILEKLQYICRKNEELNKFEESCNNLCKTVLKIKSNSEILDANQFPKISCDYYSLHTQLYTQGGFFTFSTLLSLLHATLTQILNHINTDLSDISPYSLYVQNTCKIIKSLQTLFVALNMRVNNMFNDEQRVSKKIKDVCMDLDMNNLQITQFTDLPINQNTFLQSPKINFNFNQYTDDLFHEKLYSPLMNGKHKHLFKRYKRRYCPYELPADFTNSWSNMNGWLSPRACSSKYKHTYNDKPLSSLYSRLLHNSTKLKPISRETMGNLSVNYEALNLTPRKHRSTRSTSDYLTVKIHDKKPRDFLNSVTILASSCASD